MRWRRKNSQFIVSDQVKFGPELFKDFKMVFQYDWQEHFVGTANMMLDAVGEDRLTPDEIAWIIKETKDITE